MDNEIQIPDIPINKDSQTKNTIMQIIALIVFLGLSALGAWYIYTYVKEYLNFGVALMLATIAVGGLWAVDKFFLRGYDTIEQLKKGNIAVGLSLIAYAIIISSCILAAFIVYH